MRLETARVNETMFISTETFSQKAFKRWVENRPVNDIYRYELTDGRIIMTPPAGWGHGEIEARVIRILGEFVVRQNLGRVFGSSTGYDLPSGDTLEPDASFISIQRWIEGPQVDRAHFLKIVPTLVVEIISPATARRDRIDKKKLYESNGVNEYWLLDPNRREVIVFQLRDKKYGPGRCYRANQILRPQRFPGLFIPIRTLFA